MPDAPMNFLTEAMVQEAWDSTMHPHWTLQWKETGGRKAGIAFARPVCRAEAGAA